MKVFFNNNPPVYHKKVTKMESFLTNKTTICFNNVVVVVVVVKLALHAARFTFYPFRPNGFTKYNVNAVYSRYPP